MPERIAIKEIIQVNIPADLESLTVKQLNVYAKQLAVSGWHDLRKAELITALKKAAKAAARKATRVKASGKTSKPTPLVQSKSAVSKKKTAETKQKSASAKVASKAGTSSQKQKIVTPQKKPGILPHKQQPTNPVKASLQTKAIPHPQQPPVPQPAKPKPKPHPPKPKPEFVLIVEEPDAARALRFDPKESLLRSRDLGGVIEREIEDRLVLAACDSYWLQAYWEVNVRSVERAKAAMGVDWHTALPILRLARIMADGISRQQRVHERDIRLNGHVNNWYIDVQDPPASFIVEIGFLSSKGRFFPLASSNMAETSLNPGSGGVGTRSGNGFDPMRENERSFNNGNGHRAENFERNEMFEDRQRRAMPTPMLARFSDGPIERVKVEFEVDVVVYGKTQADVQLSIKNEPIRLQPDGRFSVRFQLPEKRHVYPITAVSSDGMESQTTILAIERNTKALETVFREHGEFE